MADDAARQRLVLFGGYSGAQFADTWEWNGVAWSPVAANGPPARYYHAMAYDSQRGRTVLFGGSGAFGNFGDTWEWNGISWTQLVPTASPSGRSFHAMAYDGVRQRVVLFGGSANGTHFADTWEWDGSTWTQRTPTSSPVARFAHAMAYDSVRQRVVVFGGEDGINRLGDTWEWDGSNWVPSFSANYPPARSQHAMAYDIARQRVILFGGRGTVGNYLGDTWEWDGNNWTQSNPASSPFVRWGHSMAYDAARQRVVMFGGWNGGYMGDTWWLGTSIVAATATSFGSGCGLPPIGLVPDPSARPLLGQTAAATVVDTPTPFAWVALGWSNQFFGPYPLPVTLAGIGMPGCLLLQSSDLLGFGTTPASGNDLAFSLAIPNVGGALGIHLYLQAYCLAPGANALGILASNGVDWQFGNW